LALNDDVKFIISKHLASDLKIRATLSKNHDLQQILFGDVVHIDDLCINLQYDAKENDDFKSAKIFKMYQDLSTTRDIVYIGSTCDTLSKCTSNFNINSKSRVNLAYDKFFRMIRQSYINCKIELIENFPCNNEELKNRKTKYLTNKQKQKNKKIHLFKRIL
jgi:hypothetical protein